RGGRRDGGWRHEIRLHQRGARSERAASPVLGDARLGDRRRRQQRVRHRAPERPGARRRSVRDALDQQPGRQAPTGPEPAPGAASPAGFTVPRRPVPPDTPVTITALLGGVSKSVALTVTRSAASPPTPGTPSLVSPANRASVAQPILFDWSDVANAATYLIQISTSNNFTTLTTSQTVSVSQATIGGLPPPHPSCRSPPA